MLHCFFGLGVSKSRAGVALKPTSSKARSRESELHRFRWPTGKEIDLNEGESFNRFVSKADPCQSSGLAAGSY